MCLGFCWPQQDQLIQQLMPVRTPLNVAAWEEALASHPDRAYAQYIGDGLRQGFRVGFQYGSPLKSVASNMDSTRLHPEVITQYIADERRWGRMLGPFPPSFRSQVHINRFGLIPKGHNTGNLSPTSLSHMARVTMMGSNPNFAPCPTPQWRMWQTSCQILAGVHCWRRSTSSRPITSSQSIPRIGRYRPCNGKGTSM